MKKTRRTSRVGEVIRDALVLVFRHDLKGVDLGITSITSVEVSPDLHFARVYLSGLTEEQTRETVEDLQRMRGQARYALGKRIRLRYTPELDFKYDDTTMRASRIEAILQEVLPRPSQAAEDDPEDESAPAPAPEPGFSSGRPTRKHEPEPEAGAGAAESETNDQSDDDPRAS